MAIIPGFFGFNYTLWLIISLLRFLSESLVKFLPTSLLSRRSPTPSSSAILPEEVAVIMAVHNEELSLNNTLTALKKNVSAKQIYVGNDASTDKTASIAQKHGCQVVNLSPNRGKSKVLAYLIKHYNLLSKYKAILILDGEIIVDSNYLKTILPYFNDPEVVAFVSHAISAWHPHRLPKWSMFFTAYRIRLWFLLYFALRYGQTWKYTCATPIIPGGSSIYRSSALAQIEIDTPGLIIEDFHMTFQVYHKKLGRIASHPSAYVIDQEPYNLKDYIKQVHRWFLGFWQTFFRHGYWPSFFWFSTFFFTLEMTLYSIVIFFLPYAIIDLLLHPWGQAIIYNINMSPLNTSTISVTPLGLIIAVFVIDYALTIFVAAIERKPLLLIYGLGFFLLRYIDSFVFLWTLPKSLFGHTATGQWSHPARKA